MRRAERSIERRRATGQAWTTCTQNAEQGASCQRHLTGGPCDGGSPVVATCNPRAGESAQAYVARIGELFCGGPADAGTD